jgi:UDP-hydrolysing UDP-N-acetyl-D-glucosamine 2-epimerase
MKSFKKHLVFIATNRADFYLQNYIYSNIKKKLFNKSFFFVGDYKQYKVINSKKKFFNYRYTYDAKEDFNNINLKISKIIGNFSKKIKNKEKIIIILLGDRFETLSCGIVAYNKNIPIVHIHGGEKTIESLDQGYRDMISNIATLNFVSSVNNKKNLLKMGVNKDKIKNIGSIGASLLDASKQQNKKSLIKPFFRDKDFYIVTLHPNNSDKSKIKKEISILLSSLSKFNNKYFIFTKPNGEYGSRIIENKIKASLIKNKNFHYKENLGSDFSSYLFFCSGIIGNSSSGILESPIYNKPSINIGNRQQGRVSDFSVLNCDFEKKQIIKCFKKINNKSFLHKVKKMKSIYFQKKTIEMFEKQITNFFK